MKLLFIQLVMVLVCTSIVAQFSDRPNMKWGKITPEEIALKQVAYDSSAKAVVLFDYGESTTKGFFRHVRIKVFDKSVSYLGNASVPFYVSGWRDLVELEGVAYNVNDKGVLQSSKLDRNTTFFTEIIPFVEQVVFTVPNVREGTIFEYRYRVGFFNAFEWKFQTETPCLWSEYRTVIPSNIEFKEFLFGALPLTYQHKGFDVNEQAPSRIWVMKNVPALKKENLSDSDENYQSKLDFQLLSVRSDLESVRFGYGYMHQTFETWKKMAEIMLESDNLGKQLGVKVSNKFNSSITLDSLFAISDEKERMIAIYNFVARNFDWNQFYYASGTGSLGKTIQKRTGVSSDINLILFNLLHQAKIRVEPVLIRTRNLGRLETTFPMPKRLNHLMVRATINGATYYLDAIHKYLPYNYLPANNLNAAGIILKKDPEFVAIPNSEITSQRIVLNAKINENGESVLQYAEKSDGYRAEQIRSKVALSSKKALIDDIVNPLFSFNGDPQKIKIDIGTDYLSAVKIQFEAPITEIIQSTSSRILLPFMPIRTHRENPFYSSTRTHDISIEYPIEQNLSITFTIPEGYKVETLPPSKSFMFGDQNEMTFSARTSIENNLIRVLVKASVIKTEFSKELYESMRQYFSDIVAYQNEKIILVKEAK